MKLQDESGSNYYESGFSSRGKEETKDAKSRMKEEGRGEEIEGRKEEVRTRRKA